MHADRPRIGRMQFNPLERSRSGIWLAGWRALSSLLLAGADGPAELAAIRTAINQGFVLTPLQARHAGVADARVRQLVRQGAWRPVRYGVLTIVSFDASSYGGVDEYEVARREHALRCAAVALARKDHVVAGRSAALLFGLPVRRTPDQPILNARDVRGPGSRNGLLIRRATLRPPDETHWFGVLTTTPARTIVDLARLDRGDGLMAVDAALRERVVDREQLAEALRWCWGWPGARSARLMEFLADPLAESPLESLVRLALHEAKLPAPELQVEIGVEFGRRYRVDFLWRRQRLVLEADGRLKYTADELWEEKQRQLALTRAGYRVERVIWSDLTTKAWPLVAARLRRELALTPTS